MTSGRRLVGILAGALATVALASGSRLPWAASTADDALLRLSWRAPSEAEERCRPLTEEEQADLPVHMRAPRVCESQAIPYVLDVRVDGRPVVSDTIRGAGAREDRPIVVFREIPLATGAHTVLVSFEPLGEEPERRRAEDDDDDREEDESDDDDDEPLRLRYSGRIDFDAREVALLALDPARRRLVRVEAP